MLKAPPMHHQPPPPTSKAVTQSRAATPLPTFKAKVESEPDQSFKVQPPNTSLDQFMDKPPTLLDQLTPPDKHIPLDKPSPPDKPTLLEEAELEERLFSNSPELVGMWLEAVESDNDWWFSMFYSYFIVHIGKLKIYT